MIIFVKENCVPVIDLEATVRSVGAENVIGPERGVKNREAAEDGGGPGNFPRMQ